MELLHRDGSKTQTAAGQERLLKFLYATLPGRLLLRLLICTWVSRAAGRLLSGKLSCLAIPSFIRNNGIDMSQFEPRRYQSYNDFFTRRIRPEARPVDLEETHFISPCDSKLTVIPVCADGRFVIKHTEYTLCSLLRDDALAERYEGGQLLLFRLAVDDYHRYCFPVDARVGRSVRIRGVFHTVMPLANDHVPVYKENTREYCLLSSERFGELVMMEVGALLVGRIVNHPVSGRVRRGQEKGMFEFGGSTIVLLVEKDRVAMDEDLVRNSQNGYETVVKYGEKIGIAM